jgi:hypothetical protein
MLRRAFRTRTGQDAVFAGIVLTATSAVLFLTGTLAAHWLFGRWAPASQVGLIVMAAYLLVAIPAVAAAATPRLVRLMGALRGRR